MPTLSGSANLTLDQEIMDRILNQSMAAHYLKAFPPLNISIGRDLTKAELEYRFYLRQHKILGIAIPSSVIRRMKGEQAINKLKN